MNRPPTCGYSSRRRSGNARVTGTVHRPTMNTATPDRSGVLILRLWIEANHAKGLRARITQMLDTARTEQSVAVAASANDICAIVKDWVDAFAAPSSDGDGSVTRVADDHES